MRVGVEVARVCGGKTCVKETYYSVKRDLLQCQRDLLHFCIRLYGCFVRWACESVRAHVSVYVFAFSCVCVCVCVCVCARAYVCECALAFLRFLGSVVGSDGPE